VIRNLIIVTIALTLAAGAAASTRSGDPQAAATLSAPVYVVTGGGYGHGVGLSQYGALAQAQAGRSYRDILGFYYQGTTLGAAPTTKVRALVASGRPSFRLGSAVPFAVRDATGTRTELPAGELVLGRDLQVPVDGVPTALPGPLAFVPGQGGALTLDGKGYRGELRISIVGTNLQAIDFVGLDAYLLGVVPGEVPKEWPPEALKAQAVAARSYTLASLVKNRDFDLYADQRSQAYYGVGSEAPATTAAVKATRGEVLMYGGKVAAAFYYSSSGGRTASSQDVFGVPYPYLQARDDPWDDASPFHVWAPKTYTPATLARAFDLASPVADVEVVETSSDRPASVTLVTRAGGEIQLRAAAVQARLALRSTAFRIGVMRIAGPSEPVPAGSPVTVTGVVHDIGDAMLEKLGATGTWLPSARIAPAPDGTFAVVVHPQATATYRLRGAGLPGPALTVTVTPVATG
jgi:stage II sporulation protein D